MVGIDYSGGEWMVDMVAFESESVSGKQPRNNFFGTLVEKRRVILEDSSPMSHLIMLLGMR